jgi:RNA-splicing ligase RtcB
MFELETKYDTIVRVYAETIENEAISQIVQIANSPLGENAHIRIMPDAHAGKGCVIGTTMKIHDKVCRHIVGVDIGCGMLTAKIPEEVAEHLDILDKFLPLFANKEGGVYKEAYDEEWYKRVKCYTNIKNIPYLRSIHGTLGGGNHFIEVAQGLHGELYLIIHSGSRNLGKQVAEYYQKKAEKAYENDYLQKRKNCVAQLKAEGREKEI